MTVQLGVIGAMQRAHPALTQLWLQWTGIPELDRATFEMVRSEDTITFATNVGISARPRMNETWQGFCDALRLPPEAEGRRKMPIYLPYKAPQHFNFWSVMKERELIEVDGPIEWWWRLLVLRHKSIQKASQALLKAAVCDEPELDKAVISFRNPSLKEEGRMAKNIIGNTYKQPTHVVVSIRSKRDTPHEGLAFSLDDDSFRGRFIAKLIDLSVTHV